MRLGINQLGNASENLTFSEIRNAVTPKSYPGDIDARLPELFELVRQYSGGLPARVSNSVRQPGSVETGAKDSSHHRGNAFDIALSAKQLSTLRENLQAFLNEAVFAGLGGLGIYPTHVHIDTEDQGVSSYWRLPGGNYEWPLRHWADRGAPFWLVRSAAYSPTPDEGILVEIEKQADVKPFNPAILVFLAVIGYITYKNL